MKKSFFITLEGGEGAGKSTMLAFIKDWLTERSCDVVVTREPGGTDLGERVREILLHRDDLKISPDTEALLMFAARAEHIVRVIRPALEAGKVLLCDRFTDATYAYQSGGSGVAWDKVAALELWVHPALQPDLTLLFDVSPEIGRQRAQRGGTADRFEREEQAYFQRVREAYLRRARSCPDRVRVIDAGGELDAVRKTLEDLVTPLCAGTG